MIFTALKHSKYPTTNVTKFQFDGKNNKKNIFLFIYLSHFGTSYVNIFDASRMRRKREKMHLV